MKVYADNAATMRMRESAYNAMLPYLRENYGNASSAHEYGIKASEAVENARKTIADCIGARYNEIYFTSGATESNNWALKCAIDSANVATSAIEHESILKASPRLDRISTESNGIFALDNLQACFDMGISFVSVMYANNEIGTIQPIREIGKFCREHGIIFHTDATQAVGHIPVNVKKDNIDLLSCSAHKFGGAKGVGFLYCSNEIRLAPFHFGGGHERGQRAGTLNVPAIVSMAVALKESVENMEKENEKVFMIRNILLDALLDIPHSSLNGDRERRLANNINIRFDGVDGESLVQMCSLRGVMISSGSACSAWQSNASHVLKAIGLTDKQANESIRISLSHENTREEIDYMISVIKDCVIRIRSLRATVS